ncbi:MAG: S-layer homology domain-containing protein [Oscillospiraceae bacterium]|nr:S-layer homology domain-containing protein [Oscillospiraceae bacterium]
MKKLRRILAVTLAVVLLAAVAMFPANADDDTRVVHLILQHSADYVGAYSSDTDTIFTSEGRHEKGELLTVTIPPSLSGHAYFGLRDVENEQNFAIVAYCTEEVSTERVITFESYFDGAGYILAGNAAAVDIMASFNALYGFSGIGGMPDSALDYVVDEGKTFTITIPDTGEDIVIVRATENRDYEMFTIKSGDHFGVYSVDRNVYINNGVYYEGGYIEYIADKVPIIETNVGTYETLPYYTIGASAWAVPELIDALAANIVPKAFTTNWTAPTDRLLAAQAITEIFETATGKTKDIIALEHGWTLDATPFSDTNDDYVAFLYAAGITDGIGGGKYGTTGIFTRAQMVTMLGRGAVNILGYTIKGTHSFTDVPDWADAYIGYAVAQGITNGVSDTRFGSENPLTNEQTAVFGIRAVKAWA